jgi:competence protein ComEA
VKIYVLSADESPYDQKTDEDKDVRININTALANELETLPGIGPARAQAIISYRNEEGYFKTVDELINVKGIGTKTLENIRSLVKVID